MHVRILPPVFILVPFWKLKTEIVPLSLQGETKVKKLGYILYDVADI